jgi:glycosyltransferase involved in cell wall biosynthesis
VECLRSKRVLFLVENLPVPLDRRVWMEAKSLKNHGFDVTVICPKNALHPASREEIDGIDIFRFGIPIEGSGVLTLGIEYLFALVQMTYLGFILQFRRRFQVIHIANPPDLLFIPALIFKIIFKSKIVFDQHDLGPEIWEAKTGKKNGFVIEILRVLEAITYRVSDYVISTNASFKQIATTRGKKNDDRVFIVRSAPTRSFGLSEKKVDPARSSDEKTHLCYIGIMGEQEGIDILIESFKQLLQNYEHRNLILDLVGDGPERDKLEKLANELEITNSVVFHGLKKDKDLIDILGKATLALNPDRPSRMNDLCSGNKIVEYMALGKPIVQFDCKEGSFTAQEASILVVDKTASGLATAISLALNSQEKLDAMGAFGRKRFEDFLCWENQEATLLQLYSRISSK